MELIVQSLIPASARPAAAAPAPGTAAPAPAPLPVAPGNPLVTGRVLVATVLGAAGAGVVTLDVDGAEVAARTSLPLEAGRSLVLRVESNHPATVLKVLDDPAANADAARTGALRTALPRQLPVAGALNQLDALLGRQAAPGAGELAPQTARAAADVVRWAPPLRDLTAPETLSRAIKESGLLLEAKLAATAGGAATDPGATRDLKALLLRALAAVAGDEARAPATRADPPLPPGARETSAAPRGQEPVARQGGAAPTAEPGTLERQVEGALYRVQTRQLASLAQPAGEGQAWHVEIPVRNGRELTTLELQIERRTDGREPDGDTETPWSVRVDVDLGARGALHGQIALTGTTINATLWTDRDDTRDLVAAHLDELRDDLESVGLEIGCLACRRSPPPSSGEPVRAGTLVRTRA